MTIQKVLIIGAHPDDELLGCGGTVIRHWENGDVVHVLICCEWSNRDHAEHQEGYMHSVMEKLHVQKLYTLKLPDQRLDQFPLLSLVQPIEKVMDEFNPQVIYTHFQGDNNQDHRRVFDATMIAARPIRETLDAIYTFYTPSSTEWGREVRFSPDIWVDISDVIEKKLEAFACYESEIKPYPHPRSLQALRNTARFWGNQSLMAYAEVFQMVTRLIRAEWGKGL